MLRHFFFNSYDIQHYLFLERCQNPGQIDIALHKAFLRVALKSLALKCLNRLVSHLCMRYSEHLGLKPGNVDTGSTTRCPLSSKAEVHSPLQSSRQISAECCLCEGILIGPYLSRNTNKT